MSNTEFVIIGKILSADIDGEGSLHIILKNSNLLGRVRNQTSAWLNEPNN